MTKLEKDIISALSKKESNDSVRFNGMGFYSNYRGISQNFAILIDNYLFIRIDKNCITFYKKIFKYIDKLEYTILIGSDRISNLMIDKYGPDDFVEDIPTIFELYNKNMVYLLDKYQINFKDIMVDTVNYFDVMEDFDEMIFSDLFWNGISNRYTHTMNWWSNKPNIKFSTLEERELNKEDWRNLIRTQRRIDFIDNILEV